MVEFVSQVCRTRTSASCSQLTSPASRCLGSLTSNALSTPPRPLVASMLPSRRWRRVSHGSGNSFSWPFAPLGPRRTHGTNASLWDGEGEGEGNGVSLKQITAPPPTPVSYRDAALHRRRHTGRGVFIASSRASRALPGERACYRKGPRVSKLRPFRHLASGVSIHLPCWRETRTRRVQTALSLPPLLGVRLLNVSGAFFV